jgi:hypothetical protein
MEFSVEPEVFARLPGLRLAVVVAHDLTADRTAPDLARRRRLLVPRDSFAAR